jgi:hypothetical protein
MAAERKHASTGALAHKNANKSNMERRIVTTQMLQLFDARVNRRSAEAFLALDCPYAFVRDDWNHNKGSDGI